MSTAVAPAVPTAPVAPVERVAVSTRTRRSVRLARGAGQALAWLAIVACLGVLAAAVVVPRIIGATPYTVLTGSMRPHLPPGTLVVVRPPADPSAIATGTIVTYQLNSGDPTVVTHRVVAQRVTLTGQVQYQTKGDANPVADPRWVRPVQIRGTLAYAVPWLGRLNVLISGRAHQFGVYAAAGCLALYALSMFGGAGADRRRRRRGAHRAADPTSTSPTPTPAEAPHDDQSPTPAP